MRPFELSLEGFTSFRKPQTIAFEELDLFAITGPTGSGKSSILDAMTFALYGQTMRIGREVTELVSQGATLLKVQLRFGVKNEVYRVTRTWRNRGKTAESIAQFERPLGDEWELLASGAREVPKAIEAAVGMDYDTFTRVIVLPQGKFDEFLKGDAAKRHELLRQLAGMQIFEEMKNLASERYKGVVAEREALERQLGGLAVPDDAELEAKTQELAACEQALPAAEAARQAAARELELVE
ncbi:MAG: AAA family ATPase, partial [Candidatus Sericytochromatia bacterium]